MKQTHGLGKKKNSIHSAENERRIADGFGSRSPCPSENTSAKKRYTLTFLSQQASKYIYTYMFFFGGGCKALQVAIVGAAH